MHGKPETINNSNDIAPTGQKRISSTQAYSEERNNDQEMIAGSRSRMARQDNWRKTIKMCYLATGKWNEH